MIEIHLNLYVGHQGDYEYQVEGQDGWAVVHACKEPYHRSLLGYTTRGAPMNAYMRAHTQVCPYQPTEGPRTMKDVPAKHRRSIRLKGWDYSRAGMYFVTICVQNRVCLFGDVVNGDMRLNDAGRMVEKWWSALNHKFPTLQTDQFVVMPNHVHGIIAIVPAVGADLRVCPHDYLSAPMMTNPIRANT